MPERRKTRNASGSRSSIHCAGDLRTAGIAITSLSLPFESNTRTRTVGALLSAGGVTPSAFDDAGDFGLSIGTSSQPENDRAANVSVHAMRIESVLVIVSLLGIAILTGSRGTGFQNPSA